MANTNTEIIDPALEALLTQDEATNALLLQAYQLGQRKPDEQVIYAARCKAAASIIRTFRCSIEDALRTLSVPKKERPPIVSFLITDAKQKAYSKKLKEQKKMEK